MYDTDGPLISSEWHGTVLLLNTLALAAGYCTVEKGKWYAEPAKVADNLYFIGTKIHNSWAIVGSQGIIIIEAL